MRGKKRWRAMDEETTHLFDKNTLHEIVGLFAFQMKVIKTMATSNGGRKYCKCVNEGCSREVVFEASNITNSVLMKELKYGNKTNHLESCKPILVTLLPAKAQKEYVSQVDHILQEKPSRVMNLMNKEG